MQPYYQDDWATIYLGDCLDVMMDLDAKVADLVITSPPYNLGNNHHTNSTKTQSYSDGLEEAHYQQWQVEVLDVCIRACSGDCFYNHQHRIRDGFLIKPDLWLNRSQWRQKQEIVWNRKSPNMDKCRFFPFTERIYWLTQHESSTFFENKLGLTDDWHIAPVGASGEHKRQFPLKMCQNLMASCNAQIVLDPFMGAGTTLLGAKTLNKWSIGIEIEEKFCEIAANRLSQEVFDFAAE